MRASGFFPVLLLLAAVLWFSGCGVKISKMVPGAETQSGAGGPTPTPVTTPGTSPAATASPIATPTTTPTTTPTPTPTTTPTLTGAINNSSWAMSSGQAEVTHVAGTNYLQIILWGPVSHTPCQAYTDDPNTDARGIRFIAPAANGTYAAADLLFAFTFPNAGSMASEFATTGTLSITNANAPTVTGNINTMATGNNSSHVNGTFSVSVCP